jgi:hypothetical protein
MSSADALHIDILFQSSFNKVDRLSRSLLGLLGGDVQCFDIVSRLL